MEPDPDFLELHDVPLKLERVLGAEPATAEEHLPGRLSFGTRVTRFHPDLAPGEDWADLVAAADPARTFRHLTVACSFFPESAEQPGAFDDARLGLRLRGDNTATPRAAAIHPVQQNRPTHPAPTRKVNLNVHAMMIDAGIEQQWEAGDHEDWVIRGFGLFQDCPSWHFRRVQRYPLVGIYRVDVLAELADNSQHVVDVLLSASLKHRGRRREYRGLLSTGQREIPL
jgi:hypothetical protein